MQFSHSVTHCVYIIGGTDYNIDAIQLNFSDVTGNRVCTQFTSLNDSISENDEDVFLFMSTKNVMHNPEPSTVVIIDNDGMSMLCRPKSVKYLLYQYHSCKYQIFFTRFHNC